MKLYEIKQEFVRLADMELDEQTMNDTLESLTFELEEKADNVIQYKPMPEKVKSYLEHFDLI
jgi:hypothetical protein